MNCGKGVYKWDDDGPRVAHPCQCVVGCTTCANLRRGEAIAFPGISDIRDVYKREKIWSKVKKALEEEGKIPG